MSEGSIGLACARSRAKHTSTGLRGSGGRHRTILGGGEDPLNGGSGVTVRPSTKYKGSSRNRQNNLHPGERGASAPCYVVLIREASRNRGLTPPARLGMDTLLPAFCYHHNSTLRTRPTLKTKQEGFPMV